MLEGDDARNLTHRIIGKHEQARSPQNPEPEPLREIRSDRATGSSPVMISAKPLVRYGMPVSSVELLDQIYDFDKTAYLDHGRGTENISRALFLEWWTAFPNGFLCTFEADRPVAVVGLFPVTAHWANGFLTHAISEHELSSSTITRGIAESRAADTSHWYLSGLSCVAAPRGITSNLPCVLGKTLLNWLRLNTMLTDEKRLTVVAEGTTATGDRLLNTYAGFYRSPCPSGQRSRFVIRTSAAEVKQFVSSHPLFRRCSDHAG